MTAGIHAIPYRKSEDLYYTCVKAQDAYVQRAIYLLFMTGNGQNREDPLVSACLKSAYFFALRKIRRFWQT